ncbi:rhomboid family intramembrane serine protease [soil metagenome]
MDLLSSPITLALIVVNVAVAFYTMQVNPAALDRWSFKPTRFLRDREWWRLITAGFVHTGGTHLMFNMITLFFFGPLIESIVGPWRYLVIYFGAEIVANLLTLWRFRNDERYSAVGASGAVSGVLFAFCLFFPFESIYLFFIPIGIPAILFAVLYIVLSIYAAGQGRGKVAHEAHIGGALGGLLLTLLLVPESLGYFLRQVSDLF